MNDYKPRDFGYYFYTILNKVIVIGIAAGILILIWVTPTRNFLIWFLQLVFYYGSILAETIANLIEGKESG